MIDPKILREEPDRIRRAIAAKGNDCDLEAVLKVDAHWRAKLVEVEQLRSAQKAANLEMAKLAKGSPEFLDKVKVLKVASAQLKTEESALKELETSSREAVL